MSAVPAEAPVEVSRWWRSARYPALAVVVVVSALSVLAILGRSAYTAPLDPRNDAPDGAHALSVLLVNRGVSVSIVSSLPQVQPGIQTTILVSNPTAVSPRAARALAATRSAVVLLAPPQDVLDAMGVPASYDNRAVGDRLPPACPLAAAHTAGSVRIDGDLYTVPPQTSGVTQCYFDPVGDSALVVSRRPNGATTIVLGSAATFSNAELGTSGNAALALGLTDNAHVSWVPGGLAAGPVPRSQRGLFNLLPSRLLWATLQLFIALAVLALWRARRLGSPVVEPLPVVVRASETVEGRGRLMHAARSRDTAASALRAATIRRLSTALQLGVDDEPESVVAVVAEQTGQPAAQVSSLLYGDEPSDDAALVQLAQELPRLEAAVQRDDSPSTRRSTVKSGTS